MLSVANSGAIQRKLNKSSDTPTGDFVQRTLPNKVTSSPGQAASKAAHEGVSQPGSIASALAKQKSQKAPFNFRATTKLGEAERTMDPKSKAAKKPSGMKEALERAIERRTSGPSKTS